MKSRFIVLMVLIFVAALFTGCATTGDLEKMNGPDQGSGDEGRPGLDEGRPGRKGRSGGQGNGQLQADCSRRPRCQSGGDAKADQAAARAEAAAKLAEDNAKKAEAIFMKSMKK